MKTVAFAAAFAVLIPAAAFACEDMAEVVQVKKLSVPELAALRKTGKPVIFDANSSEFRAKNGVIPGAKLLTGSATYEPARELPAARDASLVFYCASEKCTASDKAAQRAIEAGYVDVSILPAGLKGWKGAGQPTQAIPQS